MDGITGYGKQHQKNKWWFDLEEVDGVLQIPGVGNSAKGRVIVDHSMTTNLNLHKGFQLRRIYPLERNVHRVSR